MAKLVLIVVNTLFFLTIFCVNGVFTRNCLEMSNINSCDECIRCGGYWCNKPEKQEKHCSDVIYESWCPSHRETLHSIDMITLKGLTVDPVYVEKSAMVNDRSVIQFKYEGNIKPEVEISLVNVTTATLGSDEVALSQDTHCQGGFCTTTLEAVPGTDFCTDSSKSPEYLSVKLTFENVTDDAFVKYHVPCACGCSKIVDKRSTMCNGRGSLSCGICTCDDGWGGEKCEQKKCKTIRGDLACSNPARDDVECSGNGYCDACQTCECFTDRVGSQYFDKHNYCADICMTTSECDDCLRNAKPGDECEECQSPLTVMDFRNTTLLEMMDNDGRNVWVPCNKTLPDGCYVEYAAMKDESGTVHMMVISLCPSVFAPNTGAVNVTIPVVLSLIGVVAAVATAAGFMMYRKSTPPLPMTDPEYQNIDAEDCIGENPLYKPPTSSFKNPTYGKW